MSISKFHALMLAILVPGLSASVNMQAAQANPTSNGNTDIFILETDQATYDLRRAPVISNFDWFNDGDKIGLTNGLTEADLDYLELIDFDQDGAKDDTVIKLKSTQEILGVVLDADDFVLEGEFFPVIADRQPLVCLRKANVAVCETAANQ